MTAAYTNSLHQHNIKDLNLNNNIEAYETVIMNVYAVGSIYLSLTKTMKIFFILLNKFKLFYNFLLFVFSILHILTRRELVGNELSSKLKTTVI